MTIQPYSTHLVIPTDQALADRAFASLFKVTEVQVIEGEPAKVWARPLENRPGRPASWGRPIELGTAWRWPKRGDLAEVLRRILAEADGRDGSTTSIHYG